MAFTREYLKKLGVPDEAVDQLMSAHHEEVGSVKTQLATAQQEAAGLKTQLTERDTQLAGLKKSTGDAAALQAQIAELQAANKAQAETHAQELVSLKKSQAVEAALTAARAKNNKIAKAALEDFLAAAELGEDGSIKGLAEEIKKLQKDEGTSFLFDTEKPGDLKIYGANPANPPAPKPGAGNPDPSTMTYDQYAAYVTQNTTT